MNCNDLRNDRLLEPLSEEAQGHLASCAACSARREDVRRIADRLRTLGRATAADPDPALVRRILAAAPSRAARGVVVRRPSLFPWVTAAAVALFCVLLWSVRPGPALPPSVAVNPPVPPTLPDPPLVEREPVPVLPPTPPPSVTPAPRPSLLPVPAVAPPPEPPPPAPPSPPAPDPKPPGPAPAAEPTRTTIAALTLTAVEGGLEIGEGKTWAKVESGAPWPADRNLRTAARPARFVLPDGTSVTLGRGSLLRLTSATPPELALDKGFACFDVVPGENRAFAVSTDDARLRVTGTRFTVRVDGHTEVVVAAGEVVVANDKGSVRVPAGTATSARKNIPPPVARVVDADRLTSWTRELDPPEKPRVRFDFEDGRLPPSWSSGKVVAGPARGLNRFCLEGAPVVDADLSRLDRRIPVADAELEVRFRYWTADATQMTVHLFNDRVKDNFRFEIRSLGHGKWEQVRIPLASFFRLADGTHPVQGDRFGWFSLIPTGTATAAYFDDIEIVEILR